jgi:hypothetical protein
MKNCLKPLTLLLTLACSLATAVAQAVKLTWVSSTYTNVGGYRIYAWTNQPDAQCVQSNAVQTTLIGNVTGMTLTGLLPTDYTFAATAVDTNSGAESLFSNFAHWPLVEPPSYLISVQSTTNLLTPWTTVTNASGQLFFRLVIFPP